MGRRGPSLRGSTLPATLLALLACAGCFSDPDEGPSRHALTFGYVRFASPVRTAATDVALEVGFSVGSNGCWRIEEIGLEMRGDTILVAGTAVNPHPGGLCTAEMVYGIDTLAVPPLDPGVYFIRAGTLRDTLVVEDEGAEPADRIVIRGTVHRDGGCGTISCSLLFVGLSNIPGSIPGNNLLVWGDEIDTDPCGRDTTAAASLYDLFVHVRAVAAAPT